MNERTDNNDELFIVSFLIAIAAAVSGAIILDNWLGMLIEIGAACWAGFLVLSYYEDSNS